MGRYHRDRRTVTMTEPMESDDDVARGIREVLLIGLEKRLKLPKGYVMGLAEEESDWVFIAKLGLLVEASLTEYLVAELRRPETYEHVSAIDQSKRLRLAQLLGILSKADYNLLLMLAEVRNAFVHRLENLTKPLASYIAGLSNDRKTQIAIALLGAETREAIKKNGGNVNETLPSVFRSLLHAQSVLPLITISTRQDNKERQLERAAWEKVARLKANFAFHLPTAQGLVIGPSPDGKPGPGLEGLNAKPSEEG